LAALEFDHDKNSAKMRPVWIARIWAFLAFSKYFLYSVDKPCKPLVIHVLFTFIGSIFMGLAVVSVFQFFNMASFSQSLD
jgi:hypothetical protein